MITAMVANAVNIVMAATISTPRLSLSHGTASVQMLRVEARDSEQNLRISFHYPDRRSRCGTNAVFWLLVNQPDIGLQQDDVPIWR